MGDTGIFVVVEPYVETCKEWKERPHQNTDEINVKKFITGNPKYTYIQRDWRHRVMKRRPESWAVYCLSQN